MAGGFFDEFQAPDTDQGGFDDISKSLSGVGEEAMGRSRKGSQWLDSNWDKLSPKFDKIMDTMTQQQGAQAGFADRQRKRYEEQWAPAEKQQLQDAMGWDSPQRLAQMRSSAGGTAAAMGDRARQSAAMELGRFGVKPTTLRAGALDLGASLNKTAQMTSAVNQQQPTLDMQKQQLLQGAVGTGQNVQAMGGASAAGSTAAGTAGVGAGTSPVNAFMPGYNPLGWANAATGAFEGAGKVKGIGGDLALKSSEMGEKYGGSGFGDMAGMAMSMAPMLMSDERVKTDVKPVGKTFDGQDIYTFRIGNGPHQMGVMAQESDPGVVGQGEGGVLGVDYDQLAQKQGNAGPAGNEWMAPGQDPAQRGRPVRVDPRQAVLPTDPPMPQAGMSPGGPPRPRRPGYEQGGAIGHLQQPYASKAGSTNKAANPRTNGWFGPGNDPADMPEYAKDLAERENDGMASGGENMALGGRAGPRGMQDGGVIDDPQMGTPMDMDYRKGGFIPRALSPSQGQRTDDIPAITGKGQQIRVNDNEYVMPDWATKFYGTKFFEGLIKKAAQATGRAIEPPVGSKSKMGQEPEQPSWQQMAMRQPMGGYAGGGVLGQSATPFAPAA